MYTLILNGEVITLFKCVSVRAFNVTRRAGYPISTAEECVAAAEACLTGRIRNGGYKTAAELMRAAGLGVYNIHKRLMRAWAEDGGRDEPEVSKIREWCYRFDNEFHWPVR